MIAYTNAKVFTGDMMLDNHVVLTDGPDVVDVIPVCQLPEDIHSIDCNGDFLVPAFIDLQIYGGGGQLFSAYPTEKSLKILAAQNAANGTYGCLVTLATQTMDNIEAGITAIKKYWQQGGAGIMGLHLEGPFINPLKNGAHIKEWIYSPTVSEVATLLEKADGVIKMVTLAPEVVDNQIIQLFKQAGIIVSAGHSNASLAQSHTAFENGITAVSHLFNAMSPLHHREPGLAGAAMAHNAVFASVVADGIHVHFETVKLAKRLMGDRLFYITDAVTQTNIGPYQHQLDTDHYNLPNGTLSGSALTMLAAIRNGVRYCAIPLEESLRMASMYPARVIHAQNRLGKIGKGFVPVFAQVTKDLQQAKLVSAF